MCELQKHDIIKRRLDSNGNTIEARQDGIGATKVCSFVFLDWIINDFLNGRLKLFWHTCHYIFWNL